MEATDWPQIVALYQVLLQVAQNPVVELNHAVAVGMAHGPRAGLQLIDKLLADARLAEDYRLHAVRAHLQEMAGEIANAQGWSHLGESSNRETSHGVLSGLF